MVDAATGVVATMPRIQAIAAQSLHQGTASARIQSTVLKNLGRPERGDQLDC
jgi:hypothetical protein